MASFVMIHGAWHGGWCFDPLRPLLEHDGHRLVAPDLPGMGGSDADMARITLGQWARFAADVCRNAEPPVILCGHSRGGIVISQAAEEAPEAISALVYVCAMLLPDGMSRAQFRQKHRTPNPAFDAIRRATPGGQGSVIDPAGAAAVFAQRSPAELAAAAAARLAAEPDRPSDQLLRLTARRYGSVPRHYIECSEDRAIPLADQRHMEAMQPCASVTTLAADHSPFYSAPEALANALMTIAEGIEG